MTASPSTPARPSRRGPLVALAVLVVAIAGAAGLWYLFFRPSGPAPVALGSASPVAQASAPADATAAAPGSADGIAGTWKVDPSIGTFDDFSSSFVGYRVREELATIGATEAVGRTPDVTGSITIDGTSLTAGSFEADLTTLRSDEGMRDGQLRRQALETGTFPTATFTLTAPVDLGAVPADGTVVEVTVTGDMTLHGVTKSVAIPMQATLKGGVVTVVGSLPIAFADWNIAKPRSMMVLTVEDRGTMEFQLHFTKA